MLMKLFRKPTASERAAQELQVATLERLQAQAAREYWQHTCAMLDERIVRLEYATAHHPFTLPTPPMPAVKTPRANPQPQPRTVS